MADLVVNGGKKLSGTVIPSGYKNSIVALIPATLLTDEEVTFTNVPDITDVRHHLNFLESIGSVVNWDKGNKILKINNSKIYNNSSLDEYPANIGSAPFLMPGLVHRMKKIEIKQRLKGCTLGIRQLDPNFKIFTELGARCEYSDIISVEIDDRFKAGDFWQDFQGVTPTHIFIMSAVLAQGKSTCINTASEPQNQDLCNFLVSIGAQIEGIGTNKLVITGVESLGGGEFRVCDDYYEIATFLAIGAMTGGRISVPTHNPEHMGMILKMFKRLGVEITESVDSTEITTYTVEENQKLVIEQPLTTNMLPKIEAAPWPYFPVDLLPPFIALATKAKGEVLFWNKIYEGGLLWVSELMKFGAHAHLSDAHRLIIFGNKPLRPAVVDAPYIIRVAVALFMIAASIDGESVVKSADTIKRAHPNFVANLNKLGADVKWRN